MFGVIFENTSIEAFAVRQRFDGGGVWARMGGVALQSGAGILENKRACTCSASGV